MKEKNLLKGSRRGITLIALVVTIVVLLILAGISIAMLLGEDGIITQAKNAKLETRGADVEERVEIWKVENELHANSNISAKSETDFIEELKEEKLVNDDEIDITNKIIKIGNREIYYGLSEKIEDKTAPVVVLGTATIGTTTVNFVTNISEINEADYPITIEYYKKLASESEEDYDKVDSKVITEGTTTITDSYTYTSLNQSTSYTLMAKVIDKSGNVESVTKNVTTAGNTCFVAETKVLTEDGFKNIEDIRIGIKVYSRNEKTGEIELKEVTNTFKYQVVKDMAKVYVNGNVIESTTEHPYYVVDQGWIKAGQVQKNDILVTVDGKELVVEKVEFTRNSDKEYTVYNFEVEDNHNYYVGEDRILVHNKGQNIPLE